jgi:vacuolar-type H+-ATPase subunit E/Vma4
MICKLAGPLADSLHPNKSSVYSSGGVKLVSGSRRITLDNSLDERLRLLEDRVRHVGINGFYVSDISITDAPGNQV